MILMIYFDNAATTPVKKQVLDAMMPYFTEIYGNPSSIYAAGQAAKKAVEAAREKVAAQLGCSSGEVYFTGSGTEADNWAIIGAARSRRGSGNHIITTQIEHHAVLHACENLEKEGFSVTYLPVDEFGLVSPGELEKAITEQTVLITIMAANNEIGTIQPIAELSAVARKRGILFHTDAVQAAGVLPLDVGVLGVDLLSISAHKFGGPKGVGALYIKKGVRIGSYLFGGAQERGRRAGTENTAGIVGLAAALELSAENMKEKAERIERLRDKIIKGVMEKIPYVRLNGHPVKRLPGNANFSFEFIEGESLLLMLDKKGISASSGSACTSGSLDPSHVLLAIGLKHEIAHGSLRISLSDFNTEEEADKLIFELAPIVARLREMSPLYEEAERGVLNV